MRFAVLAAPESWYLRDLQRAAGGDHQVEQLDFTRLLGRLGPPAERLGCGGETPRSLDDYDAVLVRTMPPGSLEQVVLRMDFLGRYEAAGGLVLNPARAVEAAVDKYLASARLQAAGLETPPTIVCQRADDALAAFHELGGDVVVKPLFGSEGRGITRVTDPELALRAFRMLEQWQSAIYLQQFVPHDGCDLRLFVVGDQVLGMRRCNPLDWRTNVSRGAKGEPFEPDATLCALARRAAAAIGAPLAGVDFLPGRDGRLYAIEVNAVPGWQALSRALRIDVARLVLDFTAAEVLRR